MLWQMPMARPGIVIEGISESVLDHVMVVTTGLIIRHSQVYLSLWSSSCGQDAPYLQGEVT